MQFFMENLKMDRKRTKHFFYLLERRLEPQIFSYFPAHDLNFHRLLTRSNQNKLLKEIGLYQTLSFRHKIRIWWLILAYENTVILTKSHFWNHLIFTGTESGELKLPIEELLEQPSKLNKLKKFSLLRKSEETLIVNVKYSLINLILESLTYIYVR